MWTGAILAGGRARRLGGLNKAGLILASGGESVLDRQLSRLRRVVDRTIIIANDAEQFRTAGVPVIRDLVPDGGALGALYTAVHAAPTDWTVVVACDMPFVSERAACVSCFGRNLGRHHDSEDGPWIRAAVCGIFAPLRERIPAADRRKAVQAEQRGPDSGLERP